MPDVVVTEFMNETSVAAMAEDFDVVYDPTLVDDRARLLGALDGVRALVVRNRTSVDLELVDAAPQLVVVARLGVGLDNIDLDVCRARQIEVAPATGANAVAVAEYVMASLFILIRDVYRSSDQVISGEWPRGEMRGGELAGRSLGLLGYGLIAREVASRALAMGMKVRAHDPFLARDDPAWGAVEPTELDQLVSASDAISIHVPLTAKTRGLFDGDRLATMSRGAILINTSRGGIVDERALVESLRVGHLGGAALDVFGNEPLGPKNGALFADTPNLLLTPHIAGITHESDIRIGRLTVETVRRALGKRT